MVLILKDNDRYWFITNDELADTRYNSVSKADEESLPFFKLKRYGKLACSGDCSISGDILRAHPRLFRGELNDSNAAYGAFDLYEKCKEYNKIEDEEGAFLTEFAVAKDDICYCIFQNKSIARVNDYFVCNGDASKDLLYYLCNKYKDLPLEDRVRHIFTDYSIPVELNAFPIYMMDSKDFKLKVLE